jgi:hypothetical protein
MTPIPMGLDPSRPNDLAFDLDLGRSLLTLWALIYF